MTWNAFFSVASVGLCVLCTLANLYIVRSAQAARASQDRKLRSLESAQHSLTTLTQEQSELLEALANKVKMQRVRNVVAHSAGSKTAMPDPYRDPDAWRKAMNAKLNGRVTAGE